MKFLVFGLAVAVVGVLAFIVLAPQPPAAPAPVPVPVPTTTKEVDPRPPVPVLAPSPPVVASTDATPPKNSQPRLSEDVERHLAEWLETAKAANDPRVALASSVEFKTGFMSGIPDGRRALSAELFDAKKQNRAVGPLTDATIDECLATRMQVMKFAFVQDPKWQAGFRAGVSQGWKVQAAYTPPPENSAKPPAP
jgi:hypothetical protein